MNMNEIQELWWSLSVNYDVNFGLFLTQTSLESKHLKYTLAKESPFTSGYLCLCSMEERKTIQVKND